MTNEAKCRHQLYLDRYVSEKLQALAAKPGASKSAMLPINLWVPMRSISKTGEIPTISAAERSPSIRI